LTIGYVPKEWNLHIDLLGGETSKPFHLTNTDGETKKEWIQALYPSDLVTRTFLMEPKEDGSRSKMTTSPRMFYVS
jgi:hypothetical protein